MRSWEESPDKAEYRHVAIPVHTKVALLSTVSHSKKWEMDISASTGNMRLNPKAEQT